VSLFGPPGNTYSKCTISGTSRVHIVGYKSVDCWLAATESPEYFTGRHTTTQR